MTFNHVRRTINLTGDEFHRLYRMWVTHEQQPLLSFVKAAVALETGITQDYSIYFAGSLWHSGTLSTDTPTISFDDDGSEENT